MSSSFSHESSTVGDDGTVTVMGTIVEDPCTPREIKVDAIALEAATGATVAQLAAKFGYSYAGMKQLCARSSFQERVGYYQKRLTGMKDVALRRISLHLPQLLNNEIAVALAGENPDTGEINVMEASKPASQKARQYLIDKVMPTTTRVEQTTEHVNAPETRELLNDLRGVLKRMSDERATVTADYSILDSPHVLEGTAALPSPLLVKQNDGNADEHR